MTEYEKDLSNTSGIIKTGPFSKLLSSPHSAHLVDQLIPVRIKGEIWPDGLVSYLFCWFGVLATNGPIFFFEAAVGYTEN